MTAPKRYLDLTLIAGSESGFIIYEGKPEGLPLTAFNTAQEAAYWIEERMRALDATTAEASPTTDALPACLDQPGEPAETAQPRWPWRPRVVNSD